MATPDYEDDPEISSDDVLYRRVRRDDWNPTEGRPTSAAFSDSRDGSPMSVVIGSLLEAHGLTPESALVSHPDYGLVRFSVDQIRALGFGVAKRPQLEGQPAHGWVVGKKTQGLRKRLAKECLVVVTPTRAE